MLLETLEYLGIAFICSVLLIIMSKIILQALIRRPADYYNAQELREEELMLNAGGMSITLEHDTNPEGEIMHETHLEARLGESEPAEPEEIITEIPQSVHESIEISEEPEEPDDTDDGIEYLEYTEADNYPLDSRESDDTDVTVEIDAEPYDPSAEVISGEPEDQFGFSIKAKTSRTKKPKNREEEAAAEELEQAKAVMDEAKASEESEVAASGWTESYADIRSSLEKAFTDKNAEDAPAAEIAQDKAEAVESSEDIKAPAKKNNSGRRRAPSMNMNKKELKEIAASRGIEVPSDATKRQILDLIYSDRRKRY